MPACCPPGIGSHSQLEASHSGSAWASSGRWPSAEPPPVSGWLVVAYWSSERSTVNAPASSSRGTDRDRASPHRRPPSSPRRRAPPVAGAISPCCPHRSRTRAGSVPAALRPAATSSSRIVVEWSAPEPRRMRATIEAPSAWRSCRAGVLTVRAPSTWPPTRTCPRSRSPRARRQVVPAVRENVSAVFLARPRWSRGVLIAPCGSSRRRRDDRVGHARGGCFVPGDPS
jgi:hypothetical protein